MRARSTWLGIAASIGLFFSVDAAQAGRDGYAPISHYNWSGIYVGLHAGGAWSEIDWTFLPGADRFDQDPSSFLLGGHIGLQRQWGNWVAGIEVSYSGIDLDQSSPATPPPANRENRSEIEDLFLAALRVGWAWDRSLIYLKGGYASAEVGFERRNSVNGALLLRSDDRAHGWTVGGGWEYALTPNVILGLEYNFVRLDIDDHEMTVVAGSCPASGCRVTDADADLHTVMARISFKTDHAVERAVPLK